MSVLLVGKNKDSLSYDCLGTKRRYRYMFMSAMWIPQYILVTLHFGFNLPILVPTKVELISGHCEETIHVLRRAVLICTMSSKWKEDDMSLFDHISRHHAFAMSVSGSNYVMDKINPYGDVEENSACRVLRVIQVIIVSKNWRHAKLSVGFGMSIVLMVLGCIFRWLAGRNWGVG